MKACGVRFILIAVLHLTAISSLFAENTNIIISKWFTPIQLISLESFSTWPGALNPLPVDAAVTNNRMWFVWPEAVVSLDASGAADERSLLTLYITTSTEHGKTSEAPTIGTVCPDGVWRCWNPQDSTIIEKDLSTGLEQKKTWEGPPAESLHALSDGRLLILSGDGGYLTGDSGESTTVAEKLPLLSMTAISPSQLKIAWSTPGSGVINFAEETGRLWQRSIAGDPFPPTIPWDMAWTKSMIVTAWPGRLIAFDPNPGNNESPENIYILEDERLPDRWYRIFGGTDRLLIHAPESSVIAVVSSPHTSFAQETSPEGDTFTPIPKFIELVSTFALSAADLIETEGGTQAAEGFCSWIIPYVRSFRSEHPMNPLWPELETELTRRRVNLRKLME